MKEKQLYEKLYQYVLQTGSMNVCKMKQENMAMGQIYRDTLGVRYL